MPLRMACRRVLGLIYRRVLGVIYLVLGLIPLAKWRFDRLWRGLGSDVALVGLHDDEGQDQHREEHHDLCRKKTYVPTHGPP